MLGKVHINTPMHVKDFQIEGDVNYKTTILEIDMQEEQDFVPQHSFTQKLFNNDYVPRKYNSDWIALLNAGEHVGWFH